MFKETPANNISGSVLYVGKNTEQEMEAARLVDISTWQILWGVNTFVLAIMLFLYNLLRGEIKKLDTDVRDRMPRSECEITHTEIGKKLHIHGTLGNAGEVIKT